MDTIELQSFLQTKSKFINSRRRGNVTTRASPPNQATRNNLSLSISLNQQQRKKIEPDDQNFSLDFEENKLKSRISKDLKIIKRASHSVNRRKSLLKNFRRLQKRPTVKIGQNIKLLSEMINSTKRKNFTGLKDGELDKKLIRSRQKAMIHKQIKVGYDMENMDYRSEWLSGNNYDQGWKMIRRSTARW